jgi:hypothetical protein
MDDCFGREGDEHSGPTPRGLVDSAARIEVERVLSSTNASILLIVVVLWWWCRVGFLNKLEVLESSCLMKWPVS